MSFILCNRNPLTWHQPWRPNRTVIYQRKSDDITPWTEENLGEPFAGSSCHWQPGWCQYHVSQQYWAASCAEVRRCPWSPSCCCRFSPGTEAQRAFWEPWLLMALGPMANTSLSQRPATLPPLALCDTLSSVPCGHCHPYARTRELSVWWA